MPAEITASILIGPITPNTKHGTAPGSGRRIFASNHVLVLMENSRATWIAQRCPNLARPEPSRRIRPSSPRHLLAAAVLGYTALEKPTAVAASGRLRGLTAPDGDGGLTVELLDDDLAADVYECCKEHVYAAITRLPGSTITEDELRMAAEAGLLIAAPGGDRHDA